MQQEQEPDPTTVQSVHILKPPSFFRKPEDFEPQQQWPEPEVRSVIYRTTEADMHSHGKKN